MTLADFESFGVLSVAETIGPERAKVADFWAPGKTTKSARTLGNPNEHAGIGKKNPTGDPVGFLIWWCNADLGSNSLSEQVRKDSGVCPLFAENVHFVL